MNECYIYPENMPDFNEPPYRGSLQQFLKANIGKSVRIDFLFGTNNLVSQSGIIDEVGIQYVILKQPGKNMYVTGDIYALKSITFFCDHNR